MHSYCDPTISSSIVPSLPVTGIDKVTRSACEQRHSVGGVGVGGDDGGGGDDGVGDGVGGSDGDDGVGDGGDDGDGDISAMASSMVQI